ncbi:sensor histidine kinase [Gloeobacter morelensis]|uniref:histidine kinase n=1 Tax=Gloeobacter morelensis MG652769 TaxID=2781736 RepID=A0ABY3PK92_9CYAN|nr:HAMP domain-containing sensor histidine kinase [Gloeobacter morelensis]UFP94046.1 HAMP domain-containing histidine kinase [Gloeobacter morelensis MG652769]
MWPWLAVGMALGVLLGALGAWLALRGPIAVYRALLEAAPIAYVLLDSQNRLIAASSLAGRYLELPAIGLPLVELDATLMGLVLQARRGMQVQQRNVGLKTVRGDWTVGALAVPLPGLRVGLYIDDQSAVAQLLQQRDRWVGDAAHELKTPLTSIRLVAEMVLPRVGPDQQRWIERLLGEVQRLNLLVQDLLEFSRWQAGRTQLNLKEGVDLVQLVAQTWATLEPLAEHRQVRLEIDSPASVSICADEERLYRALLNLLDNAVRYSPKGEAFWVRLRSRPDWVTIEIIDSGPGFPRQDLDRVFERFYRADPARARQTGGTGLGLAIVRQIVEAHQGMVKADNHPETGGAWLSVRLPVLPVRTATAR